MERALRQRELEEERALTREFRVALRQVQTEIEEEKAMQLVRSHEHQPTSQVLTIQTEHEIDSNKLVIPMLNAKDEPELERWLVKARTGLQAAAPGPGQSFFAKAEAVGRMNVEDWRDTAAHQRAEIVIRDPDYTRLEKDAEEKLGALVISKLPVEAQEFAQQIAISKGGVLELHVALSKAFLMIMATTSDEKDALVDVLKKKQSVPAKKVMNFMRQYKLDYQRLIACGFIQESEDHSKFFKAVQYSAMNPARNPSFVTADVIYKREHPPPTLFTSKKYFVDYLEFVTNELYGHQDYGEHHGNTEIGGDLTHDKTCIHPTCEDKHGHTIDQCPTRRREQSEKDKTFAAAAKATATEGTAENTKKRDFACRMLVNGSTCRYGSKCMFSHDPEVVHAFKNKICPWGAGCSFNANASGCSYGIHEQMRAQLSAAGNRENGKAGGLSLDALAQLPNDPDYMPEDGDDAWYVE